MCRVHYSPPYVFRLCTARRVCVPCGRTITRFARPISALFVAKRIALAENATRASYTRQKRIEQRVLPLSFFSFIFGGAVPLAEVKTFPFFVVFPTTLSHRCVYAPLVGKTTILFNHYVLLDFRLRPTHVGSITRILSRHPCSIPNRTLIYSICLHIFPNNSHLRFRLKKSLTTVIRLGIKFLTVHRSSTRLDQLMKLKNYFL